MLGIEQLLSEGAVTTAHTIQLKEYFLFEITKMYKGNNRLKGGAPAGSAGATYSPGGVQANEVTHIHAYGYAHMYGVR